MLSPKDKLKAIDTTQETFPMCFACGQDNPVGLKLKFRQENGEATCDFILDERYQGWGNIVHGGILFTILDEAMAYTHFPAIKSVTARSHVRFRHPAPTGVPMLVTGKLVERKGKLLTLSASIRLKDGTVVAEATSQSFVVG